MAPIEIELDGEQVGISAETHSVIELPDLDLRIEYHGDEYGRRATVYYKGYLLSESIVGDTPTSIQVNPRKIPPIEKGEPHTVVSDNLVLRKILQLPD